MPYVRRACNIGSVYHASVARGYVPVSTSSNLIYHFQFLKHHHQQRRITTTAVTRGSCHTHENCMDAEQIIIIFYIYFFIFWSMYLVLFSIVLYRTIVTVYTGYIFLYNYLQQMHQIIIIHLSPVGCFTPALAKSMQKNRVVSWVNREVSGVTVCGVTCGE